MSTDTNTSQLIINKLTKAQYEAISSPSDTELYLTPDTTAQDIEDAVSAHNSSSSAHSSLFNAKQATLVSGTNIKTINTQSILGSGDITIQSAPETDDETISLNSSDELQAIGVINNRDNSTALKTWTGTKAQYDAITTKDANTTYIVTDDNIGSITADTVGVFQDISALSSGTITIESTKSIYSKTISENTTFTFDVSGLGTLTNKAVTFELFLNRTAGTITFPSSVTWIDEPDFTTAGKYLVVFKTFDGGTTWLGNCEASWS